VIKTGGRGRRGDPQGKREGEGSCGERKKKRWNAGGGGEGPQRRNSKKKVAPTGMEKNHRSGKNKKV